MHIPRFGATLAFSPQLMSSKELDPHLSHSEAVRELTSQESDITAVMNGVIEHQEFGKALRTPNTDHLELRIRQVKNNPSGSPTNPLITVELMNKRATSDNQMVDNTYILYNELTGAFSQRVQEVLKTLQSRIFPKLYQLSLREAMQKQFDAIPSEQVRKMKELDDGKIQVPGIGAFKFPTP